MPQGTKNDLLLSEALTSTLTWTLAFWAMWKIFALAKQIQLEYRQSNSKSLYCLLPPAIQSLTIRSNHSSGRKVQSRMHVPVGSSRNHKSKNDCPGSQSRPWEPLPSHSCFTSLVAIWKMACYLNREFIQAQRAGTRRSEKATWVWCSLRLGTAFSTYWVNEMNPNNS